MPLGCSRELIPLLSEKNNLSLSLSLSGSLFFSLFLSFALSVVEA